VKREDSDEVATLYGLVVSHTVVAVVTYDARKVDSDVRALATFDLGNEGQDVWNALAIAIVVCTVRNFLAEQDPPSMRQSIEDEDNDA